MKVFNWANFFDRRGITWTDTGPNVAKGHINIACPFCGDDPSEHMGVELSSGAWGCWRNSDHRGRSPFRLIQALLGCSYVEARGIVDAGSAQELGDFAALADQLRSDLAPDPPEEKAVGPTLRMPKAFRTLDEETPAGRRVFDYLVSRGFTPDDADDLIRLYDLRYAMSGAWKYRLIIPIRFEGALVNWTARSISKTERLRYKTLSHDPETAAENDDPVALRNIKHCVYNYDRLMKGGRVLVAVEGPLDALKFDFYARGMGVRATSLFGTAFGDEQVWVLAELFGQFERRIILFDQAAEGAANKLASRLSVVRPTVMYCPPAFDDPGDMTERAVVDLARQMVLM